jgi:sialic acid synthase SpsE/quercetin dioxygenase-like cupin family protein
MEHLAMKLLDDRKVDFNGLITFELANNHQGDVEHGKRIIRELAVLARQYGVRAAIKLQFRDLDTFVHPDYRQSTENKHIPRFLSTRLFESQFAELVAETKAHGLITMCTPFDEPSVDLIKKLDIEILKIGSCSAKDWPLLEKASSAGKPMIVSTGGLTIKDVDKLVSFLDHRYAYYALMHCVSIYPTPMAKLQLNTVERYRQRYPHVTIGFSTHEEPGNVSAIQIAYAKGARLFEKHVAIPTEQYKINAYSATPEDVAGWLAAYQDAVAACGPPDVRIIEPEEELDLFSLQRGVFAKRDIKQGEPLVRDDVFFAFPIQAGQLASGQWREGLVADRDYLRNAAISEILAPSTVTKKDIIYHSIHEVKGMLNTAKIFLGTEFNVELSHHYGIDHFREVGATIIDCVNREYCKKVLVMLPGQQHPYHHHRKKEETFQVLAGELWVELEGRRRILYPGDTLLVQRGLKHRFWSEAGAIFEEISSTHYNDDSIYDDPAINEMSRESRKTKLINWGRHQFD